MNKANLIVREEGILNQLLVKKREFFNRLRESYDFDEDATEEEMLEEIDGGSIVIDYYDWQRMLLLDMAVGAQQGLVNILKMEENDSQMSAKEIRNQYEKLVRGARYIIKWRIQDSMAQEQEVMDLLSHIINICDTNLKSITENAISSENPNDIMANNKRPEGQYMTDFEIMTQCNDLLNDATDFWQLGKTPFDKDLFCKIIKNVFDYHWLRFGKKDYISLSRMEIEVYGKLVAYGNLPEIEAENKNRDEFEASKVIAKFLAEAMIHPEIYEIDIEQNTITTNVFYDGEDDVTYNFETKDFSEIIKKIIYKR